jgi:subtilisin family serine protease
MTLHSRSRRLLTTAGGIVLSALLAVGVAASPAYAEGAIHNADHPDAIPGSYIVVLKEAALARGVPAHAADLARQHGGKVGFVYDAALNGFSVTMSESAARRLAAHPMVSYVEQDATVSLQATQNDPPSWGLDRIDQRNLPLNSTYNYRNSASNVRIYILDTGVRLTHDDFGGRAFTGFDAVTSGGTATDCNGHGTHVAGTAAGTEHGVAKQARIISVRVLGCNGTGSSSQVIAGVNWVTNNAIRPAVANMSMSSSSSSSVNSAVSNSIAAGITYAVAAGNSNANACNYSPASVSSAITVGSTTSSDARSSFSNWGSCVDLFAPGSGITSAWWTNNSATAMLNGTSMAAPHVAGAAAIVLSANPTWTPGRVWQRLHADATNGVVGSPGSGSPNRLLYAGTGGTKPIITSFLCESGSGQFTCFVEHHSYTSPVTITWRVNGSVVSAWTNLQSVFGGCDTSTSLQVTVSNPYGSSSSTWSQCRTGPWL